MGRLTYTSDGNVWYFIGVWAIDEFGLLFYGGVGLHLIGLIASQAVSATLNGYTLCTLPKGGRPLRMTAALAVPLRWLHC